MYTSTLILNSKVITSIVIAVNIPHVTRTTKLASIRSKSLKSITEVLVMNGHCVEQLSILGEFVSFPCTKVHR